MAVLWTPEYITTALWLNADDLSAGALAQWDDDSGNARHATQATGANQPTVVEDVLNGLPVVRFDGSNDFLQFPTPPELLANAPKSIFAVFKGRGVGSYDFAIATRVNVGGVDNNSRGHLCIADTRTIYSHTGSGDSIVNSALTRGTAYQCEWSVGSDGANPAHYRDGTGLALTTDTLSAATPELANGYTVIGRQSTGYSGGDLTELLMIAGGVDNTLRQRIQGYYAHKWGLAGSLDAAHPYKSAAPTVPTVTLTIRDRSGNLRANATGLTVLFFDQADPALISTPRDVLTNQSTDGSGQLSVDIPHSTLANGEIGHIWITNSDGTVSQHWAVSVPVAVSVA